MYAHRIALFGGTFDPIHTGHLFLAQRARSECSLDRVIFIPCYRSPHKLGSRPASAEDRLQMTKLATEHIAWAEVSDVETQGPQPSYSWKTAAHFRALYPAPEARLFWIIGADQWRVIETWTKSDYLAEYVTFIVFPRGESSFEPKRGYEAVFLDCRIDLSATEIRDLRRRGLSLGDRVPKPVGAYIETRGLYRPRTEGFDKSGRK